MAQADDEAAAAADTEADAIGDDEAEFVFDKLFNVVDKESGVKLSGEVIWL